MDIRRSPSPTFQKSRLSSPLVIIGAVVVALVLVIVVVVVATQGSSKAPVAPPSVSLGETGLSTAVLTQSDVGFGWLAHPPLHAVPASVYTQGPCGSTLWAHDTGSYSASYVNGSGTAFAHGAVISQILEAPSPAVAAQQAQYLSSSAYLPCLRQIVAGEARSLFPPGSVQSVGGVSAQPLALAVTSEGATVTPAFQLTISLINSGGANIIDDSVRMFSGPYEAALDVSWCTCAPLDPQVVQQDATRVAALLGGLPPGGVKG
ncbi:MAG TPA: hypothetical protein VGI06_03205 [Acidimicrobiales bacterium]